MASSTKAAPGGVVIKPRAIAILAFAVGLFPIFDINDWRFSAATFFLGLAWMAIVGTGLFLWRAGFAVASEDPGGGDVGFELTSRRAQLLADKKVLLKAIKEIEFDHQMGKMSDADAEALTRSYRAEAIEIIKVLDEDGGDDSVEDAIEKELRARMKVASATKKKKGKAKKAKAKEPAAEAAMAEKPTKAEDREPKAEDREPSADEPSAEDQEPDTESSDDEEKAE
ncbi:MAG: hypothetical protein KJO07_07320 [Deltaproteobacteria bacterium]|nr:hypothetical protein [Deltaproteobacteria bacterium]